ncbi:MAG: hypothetical protein ACE5R6_02290 [Candidatus Heimdallarchaeota archaeon]
MPHIKKSSIWFSDSAFLLKRIHLKSDLGRLHAIEDRFKGCPNDSLSIETISERGQMEPSFRAFPPKWGFLAAMVLMML